MAPKQGVAISTCGRGAILADLPEGFSDWRQPAPAIANVSRKAAAPARPQSRSRQGVNAPTRGSRLQKQAGLLNEGRLLWHAEQVPTDHFQVPRRRLQMLGDRHGVAEA